MGRLNSFWSRNRNWIHQFLTASHVVNNHIAINPSSTFPQLVCTWTVNKGINFKNPNINCIPNADGVATVNHILIVVRCLIGYSVYRKLADIASTYEIMYMPSSYLNHHYYLMSRLIVSLTMGDGHRGLVPCVYIMVHSVHWWWMFEKEKKEKRGKKSWVWLRGPFNDYH